MRETQVVHANDPNAQNPVISRNLKLVPSRSSICPLRYCLSIRKLGFAVSKESFSAENSKMWRGHHGFQVLLETGNCWKHAGSEFRNWL